MDFRYLLIQSIALLYWESTLTGGGVDSRGLVKEILEMLPAPESMAGTDEDKDNLIVLRDICGLMVNNSDTGYTREFLLNKVKLSIKKDVELRGDIEAVLGVSLNQERTVEHIKLLNKELQTFFHQRHFKEEIKRIASKTIFAGAPDFNVSEMAKAITASMERFVTTATNNDEDPIINEKGDSNNLDGLVKLFTNVQEDLDADSVIKSGWQAFNRMCGEVGGLRRGNMYVIGARPSNGKSLVSSCLTLHSMVCNKPYLFDKTKKPAIVAFSTENDLGLNLRIWFKYLWENKYNTPCNLQEQTPESMAEWFKNEIEQNEHKFFFYYINSTNTGYRDIIGKMMQIESEGYEIILCNIDYLAMITNSGLGDEHRAFWIRQLFKSLRSFTNPRKICLLTPHQVSPDSSLLLRQGTDDFVRQIAGKRYWADCKSIDMEVDMEILLNIEKVGKGVDTVTYMSFGRGKDRSTQGTPDEDCFFFLPFAKIGGLRMDLGGKDTSKRSIRDSGMNGIDTNWGSNDDDMTEF